VPRGLYFHIEALGVDEAEDVLKGVSYRMQHAGPAFDEVATSLEEGEKRHFTRLRGRYVDSGDLMASLTQSTANGAIRDSHADELVFGSSIYYAKFLRKGKKSAVLVLLPKERKTAAKTILDYVTYGVNSVAL
jgi:hypothetical protein